MNVRIAANALGMLLTGYLVVGCKSAHSSAAVPYNLREITSPALPGSISPRVTSARDGSVLLSWLEPENEKTAALRYSFWRDKAWSATATVASARPFSRHPSESPAIVALSEKNLIAYWSQKPQNAEDRDKEVDVYSPFPPIAELIGLLRLLQTGLAPAKKAATPPRRLSTPATRLSSGLTVPFGSRKTASR